MEEENFQTKWVRKALCVSILQQRGRFPANSKNTVTEKYKR